MTARFSVEFKSGEKLSSSHHMHVIIQKAFHVLVDSLQELPEVSTNYSAKDNNVSSNLSCFINTVSVTSVTGDRRDTHFRFGRVSHL